jgi:hypothetical protein
MWQKHLSHISDDIAAQVRGGGNKEERKKEK